MNLRAMATLREAFGVPVGLSDHTEGIAVPTGAVALGAELDREAFHARPRHDRAGPRLRDRA